MKAIPPIDDLVADRAFAFRTPLLPLEAFTGWVEDAARAGDAARAASAGDAGDRAGAEACARLRRRLRALVDRPSVNEAIFLASPSLHESLDHWRAEPDTPRGQRTERALVRYVARMAGRATPFGLFSGVSVGRVGGRTRLEVAEAARYGRSTRLDNDYLFALMTDLRADPAIRGALPWRPSSSLYPQSGKLRYAEARLSGTLRTYHLVGVEATEYLEATLARARDGATLRQLADALVADDPEIAPEEAAAFVDELVSAQLLVCDLAPAVTGAEPLVGILAQLEGAAPGSEAAARLRQVAARLAEVDARAPGAGQAAAGADGATAAYREMAEVLAPLPTRIDMARLFQVDMTKPAPEAALGDAVVTEVLRGLEVLRRISPAPEDDALARFRRAFVARYEEREVPLTEALDEEAGVGFDVSTAPEAAGAPLLEGLAFPGAPRADRVAWGPAQAHLLRRVEAAWARGDRELVLDERDVEAMSAPRTARLADAVAVMAQVGAASPEALARGDVRVVLGGCSGPSGARLLGRFCHASPDVHALVTEHLRAEEALRPDAAFAEIVHLNQGRIGNILCRPVLRGYEIPFLGVSGAPRDRHIPLQDLAVSVRGDRVVLRSRRLGREVVPRMSTAHNFRLMSIGIYRFLCTLQSQDGGGVGWSWGPLSSARFLPRVRYRKLVFARAQWTLDERDLEPVARAVAAARRAARPGDVAARRADVFAAAQALRQGQGLPRLVALADGDNELPIDLDNALSVASAAWLMSKRERAQLVEVYPTPDLLAARGPEGAFTHELVVTFTRRPRAADAAQADAAQPDARRAAGTGADARQAAGAAPVSAAAPVRRRFAPGSEWLYVKLYTGTAGADEVLRRIVAPVRERALASGAADRWFFLRYGDPDHHVRVRFRGDPRRLMGEVVPALHAAAEELAGEGTLWRVQLDTYEREVERYGGPAGMELSEEVFWRDSEAVLGIVELLEGDAGADARWRLALRGADQLLADLGLDAGERLALAARARDSFRAEFGADAALYRQIGARFRAEKDALLALLARDPAHDEDSDLAPGLELYADRSAALAAACAELGARDRAGALSPPLREFAWSHVHMHVNRLLHASQRAQELVLYDFLHRCHAAGRARSGR